MKHFLSLLAMLAVHNAALGNEGTPAMKCTPVATDLRTDFPASSQENGFGGSLVVGIKLGKQGEVISARLIQSSGRTRLDNAALSSATRLWRFNVARCSETDLAREFRQVVTYRATRGLPFSGAINRAASQRVEALAADERCTLVRQSHETTVAACRRTIATEQRMSKGSQR